VPPGNQFQYGFCCGQALACGCGDPYLDCADLVCLVHDLCLHDWVRDTIRCQGPACDMVKEAIATDCCQSSPSPGDCRDALALMRILFCSVK
jgi:hypothetical protein